MLKKIRLSDDDGYARGPFEFKIGAKVVTPDGTGLVIDGIAEWDNGRSGASYDVQLENGDIIKSVPEPAVHRL